MYGEIAPIDPPDDDEPRRLPDYVPPPPPEDDEDLPEDDIEFGEDCDCPMCGPYVVDDKND